MTQQKEIRDVRAELLGFVLAVIARPELPDRPEILLKFLKSFKLGFKAFEDQYYSAIGLTIYNEINQLQDKYKSGCAENIDLIINDIETLVRANSDLNLVDSNLVEYSVSNHNFEKAFTQIKLQLSVFIKINGLNLNAFTYLLDSVFEEYAYTSIQNIYETFGTIQNPKRRDFVDLANAIGDISSEVSCTKEDEGAIHLARLASLKEKETLKKCLPISLGPFNFTDVIKTSNQLPPNKFIIIGAPSGTGKTAYGVQIIISTLLRWLEGQRSGKPIGQQYITFYSVEMPKEVIYQQLARFFWYQNPDFSFYREESVFVEKFLKPSSSVYEEQEHLELCEVAFQEFLELSGWDQYIRILDNLSVTCVEDIRADLVMQKARGKTPQVIIIDYLQCLSSNKVDVDNDYTINNIVSNTVRDLTREFELITFGLAQLKTDTKPYDLENLPDSFQIRGTRQFTQDADIILNMIPEPPPNPNEKEESKKTLPPVQTPFEGLKRVYGVIVKNRIGHINNKPKVAFIHNGNGLLLSYTVTSKKRFYAIGNYALYFQSINNK